MHGARNRVGGVFSEGRWKVVMLASGESGEEMEGRFEASQGSVAHAQSSRSVKTSEDPYHAFRSGME